MFALAEKQIVTMQYSVVVLLVIICLQAAPAFKENLFRYIGCAWLANFLYLVSSIGSGTIGALLHLSQYHVTAPAAVFNFLAASLFWYAAHKGGRSAHKIYLSRMRTSTFLAVPFGCFATSMVLLHVLPQDHFLGFFISIFPRVALDTAALIALSFLFQELASQSEPFPQLSRGRVLYGGAIFYAAIQPLQFAAFGPMEESIAMAGFLLGLAAKFVILLGIVRLLVTSTQVLTTSTAERIAEQKRVLELGHTIDVLAHELGTPISEILARIPDLSRPNKLAVATQKIESAASRADALLYASKVRLRAAGLKLGGDLNAYETQSDGKFNQLQSISINTLVEIAQIAVQSARPNEKIYFGHQYAANCCLECVPNEIIQVVINLFRNSYDSMARAGSGKIDVRTLNDRDTLVDDKAGSLGKIKIIIRDSGEGIPEENIAQIFDEGFTTRSGEGRGHGLAVVRGLVDKNHGVVELHSGGDRGTEAVLTFPRSQCEPAHISG